MQLSVRFVFLIPSLPQMVMIHFVAMCVMTPYCNLVDEYPYSRLQHSDITHQAKIQLQFNVVQKLACISCHLFVMVWSVVLFHLTITLSTCICKIGAKADISCIVSLYSTAYPSTWNSSIPIGLNLFIYWGCLLNCQLNSSLVKIRQN